MRYLFLCGLLVMGCGRQEVRYTDCVNAIDGETMQCRRAGTEYYREFRCAADGRCTTIGVGGKREVYVRATP